LRAAAELCVRAMSASITLGNARLIGTNGAIEACVAVLVTQAQHAFGMESDVTKFLIARKERFFPGLWVALDDVLPDVVVRKKFLEMLQESLKEMEGQQNWTEVGREWLRTEVPAFIAEIESAL